jgi:hypothetical protein
VEGAAATYAEIDSYIVRLTRREMLRDRMQPEEVLLVRFRKEPWSVYFKWVGKEGAGREVVYVKGHYEDKIHTLLAAGDVPFMPAGKRMAVAPDNVLVRSASRHPITEAGLGSTIDSLSRLLPAIEAGDPRAGTLTSLGPLQRPEYARPLDALEHRLPPGRDPNLPQGGRRIFGFDPESHLPLFVQTFDAKGQEVERYVYDRLLSRQKLDADDFNPDKLWGHPGEARASRSRP